MATEVGIPVYLDGMRTGVLSSDLRTFQYDAADVAYTPISLSLPRSMRLHGSPLVGRFFANLLPYSEAVSSRALLRGGFDMVGAMQMGEPIDRPLREVDLRLLSFADVSNASAPPPLLGGHSPKLAIRQHDHGWTTSSWNHPSTHIAKKLQFHGDPVEIVEFVTMRAARAVKLSVPDVAIVGETLVVERFDRWSTGDGTKRVHQEDLCQAMGLSRDDRHERNGSGPGLSEIGSLLAYLKDEGRGDLSSDFFCAFTFNSVLGRTDAHAKNYSIQLDGQKVRLCPLYDLVAFPAFWDGERAINPSMSVAGTWDLRALKFEDLIRAGTLLGLPESSSAEIISSMTSSLLSAMFMAAEEARALVGDLPVLNRLEKNLVRLPLLR